MSLSRKPNFAIEHHGLYLVDKPSHRAQVPHVASGALYRIVTVAAALFLAMTIS
jgi:hypothetical protein